MRNITLKQWVLAVLFLLMPLVADAAGLGRLIVLSSLGQPLNAEIDLVSVNKDELSTLSARVAPPDMYKQANLQYNEALIGLRLSIEKRANGQPYVKLSSNRPVSEPFIDLLIELNWASGRITREYTALLDPPGFGSSPPVASSPSVAAPQALPPAASAPITAAPTARPAVAAPLAGAKEYGPIKRGETLGKIAASLKPEGVTLEQMLVGLYRNNPDAFINKNLNLVKSGKILRVPEREELVAVPQQEAMKEYRAQVTDWGAYRRQLADAAVAAPESRTATSGKITPRIEDKAAGEGTKDVVRLSKGEPPGGASGKDKPGSAERVRVLEEEVVAREKALREASDRIAQLEKTIADQQRLLALKNPGMAAAQQQAQPAPQPEVSKPAAAPKPEPAKAAAASEAVEAKKDQPAAVDKVAETKPGPPKDQATASDQKPKPKPEAVPAPPPPGEPSLIDTILSEPLYLAAGGAILLAGLGLWMQRRRSAGAGADNTPVKLAPTLDGAANAVPGVAPGAKKTVSGAAVMTAADEVDPLAEAEVYIAYGRDGQAEEILKEALARNPGHEQVQLKLLEIYAARKDTAAFGKLAAGFNKLTGGQGENWQKVAVMGYALDAGNSLYAAGKYVPAANLDFDLGASGTGSTSTDITLDAAVAQQASAQAPDFTLDVPAAGSPTSTDITLDAHSPADGNSIDFDVELPKVDESAKTRAIATNAPHQGKDAAAGLDFKLDIPDINLDQNDQAPAGAAAGNGKDAHWYDVQTKFDLAKAYQEMGDKDGAREILQEVLKEGDAQQQAEAESLINRLA